MTNRRLSDRSGPDYYPTPEWATKAILYYEHIQGVVIEPCAGEHDMVKVLQQHGIIPYCYDAVDYGMGDMICDFRQITRPCDVVITNPPFKYAEEMVGHFLKIARDRIILLLRLSFLEGEKRYRNFTAAGYLRRVYVFTERLSMYPKVYTGEKNGGTTAYGWFVFDNNPNRHDPVIKFIEPGFKPKSKNVF